MLVGGAAYEAYGTPLTEATLAQALRQRRGAVRRASAGRNGTRCRSSCARARHPAAAQGNGSVRQSAPGGGVRCARRRVEPEARARRRARSDDRARTDRRHLFRRAARRSRPLPDGTPPRHQHRSLHRGRDRARRPRRPASWRRSASGRVCEVDKANVMESGGCGARSPQRVRDADYPRCRARRSCTPTIARCSWCATRSSST